MVGRTHDGTRLGGNPPRAGEPTAGEIVVVSQIARHRRANIDLLEIADFLDRKAGARTAEQFLRAARQAKLHNAIIGLLGSAEPFLLPPTAGIYAAAIGHRGKRPAIKSSSGRTPWRSAPTCRSCPSACAPKPCPSISKARTWKRAIAAELAR